MASIDKNKFQFVKRDDFASEAIDAPAYSYWRSVIRQFLKKKSSAQSLFFALPTQKLICDLPAEGDGYLIPQYDWHLEPVLIARSLAICSQQKAQELKKTKN